MHKAVLLQLAATSIAALVAGALFGPRGFVSAIWGGLAYVLPSILFAWRLSVSSWRGENAKAAAFFVGELVKLLSTIGLLALATVLYKDLHWGAFLVGLVLAVKANLFAFLVKTRT
ncbi:MAG: ATP synthase subunit I [Betaproteobacteria bacterium]|nr:ATP synthase subunit I [Betaproteobacteria bacterium]MCL2162598.1 ATP synthase subunit I [Betaproteobacteria bacterium]